MKKLILLLCMDFVLAHLQAMPPHQGPNGVCKTIEEIVEQIAYYERLSAPEVLQLSQVLHSCKNQGFLFNPIEKYGPIGKAMWNKWRGYENGITIEALQRLKPFIKSGGTPFLDQCLAGATIDGDLKKADLLIKELKVSVNALDTRNKGHECPIIQYVLYPSSEHRIPVLKCFLENKVNTETILLMHGYSVTPLGFMLDLASREITERFKPENLEIINLLLEHDANFDNVNDIGENFIQLLERSYHNEQSHCRREKLPAMQEAINKVYALPAVAQKIAERQEAGMPDLVLSYRAEAQRHTPEISEEEEEEEEDEKEEEEEEEEDLLP